MLRHGAHFVGGALGYQFAFKLGKHGEHVAHKLACGRAGVYLLTDGYQFGSVFLEMLLNREQVYHGAGEAVKLVDYQRVDFACTDALQYLLEFGAVSGVFA
ncbi:MAG: hypothetical protein N2554_10025 [Fimbriimonadales bacterium]|nr:hypothetical protein [Fimbriimonadales bacterium]